MNGELDALAFLVAADEYMSAAVTEEWEALLAEVLEDAVGPIARHVLVDESERRRCLTRATQGRGCMPRRKMAGGGPLR